MAYADLNTIHNPSTGTSPPASWGDQVRDNFEFFNTLVGSLNVGFADWSPSVLQSVAVSRTLLSSGLVKLGRLAFCFAVMSITSAGTAGQVVQASTPHTSAFSGPVVGQGRIYDASANTNYVGIVELQTTGFFVLTAHSSNNFMGVSVFTAGLASGDALYITALYETAT